MDTHPTDRLIAIDDDRAFSSFPISASRECPANGESPARAAAGDERQ